MTWQPIATAAKDGRKILGFDPSLLGIVIAEWDGSGWYVDKASQDGLGFENTPLTHWAPLPDPPDGDYTIDRAPSGFWGTKTPWQPIETAPRDGTELLLCAADTLVLGRFYRGVGQWADVDKALGSKAGWFWAFAIRPTHWMPLPN